MWSPFAKVIFWLGASKRNPSLRGILKELKSAESLSRDELHALQLKKLKKLIELAYQYSPYYRQQMETHGLLPNDIQTLDDLKRFPIIDKSTLITHNSQIHTAFPFKKRRLAETSGTSGESLAFYRNEEWDSTNRANVMRSYAWYNVNVWDKNGYFWGYNIDQTKAFKIKVLDWLQNRMRIFRYDDASISHFAKQLNGAKFLSGYSSMIYQIAKKVNDLGLKIEGIKMVKGTSEMILDAYQPDIEKAFGKKMISEYGAAESGLIAFECPHGSQHICMETVIVEVDDNSEILVTNLASLSFPIIRYRLGDCVKLSEDMCSCGRQHLVLDEILGRKGTSIKGNAKEYPALTFYYVFKNLALEHHILVNYKIEQHKLGHVNIVLESVPSPELENLIGEEMQKYFADDLSYSLTYTSKFSEQLKKRQYFESFL